MFLDADLFFVIATFIYNGLLELKDAPQTLSTSVQIVVYHSQYKEGRRISEVLNPSYLSFR